VVSNVINKKKILKNIQPAYQYEAIVTRVIDGDTLVVQVDLGFKVWAEKTLRLARINSPELSTPAGVISREYLNKYLLVDNKGAINFLSKKLDVYGRSIAEVQVSNNSEGFLSDLLVLSGNAVYKKY
jgi:endonuclease YncB( thermonuclease family)